MRSSQEGRHANLCGSSIRKSFGALKVPSWLCRGADQKLSVDVYSKLKRLHKELKLLAVVLQLNTEFLIEYEIWSRINSCDKPNDFLY